MHSVKGGNHVQWWLFSYWQVTSRWNLNYFCCKVIGFNLFCWDLHISSIPCEVATSFILEVWYMAEINPMNESASLLNFCKISRNNNKKAIEHCKRGSPFVVNCKHLTPFNLFCLLPWAAQGKRECELWSVPNALFMSFLHGHSLPLPCMHLELQFSCSRYSFSCTCYQHLGAHPTSFTWKNSFCWNSWW